MAIRFDDDVVFVNLIGEYALYNGFFEDRNMGSSFFTAPVGSKESGLVLHDNRLPVVEVIRKIYDEKLSPYFFAGFYEAPAHVCIMEVNEVITVQVTPARCQAFPSPWKYLYLGLVPSLDQIPNGDRILFERSKFVTVPIEEGTSKIFRQAFIKIVELEEGSIHFFEN